ncbi:hypothetical protein PU634_10545 [Oceanimonas pelagia]|uniref:Uncharacterized protein n=1 Tax=Oceanimonas pelagia TaxID=3028314 RepID=A0AA50KKN8_9GAMM|nr:hypothetical protein [Oceanimonas pelagia]WMC09555.1 hypothetical protein PU634_10545 [Oceanimonas pelagia]
MIDEVPAGNPGHESELENNMQDVLFQIHNLAAQAKALYNDEAQEFNELLDERDRLELALMSAKDQLAKAEAAHEETIRHFKKEVEKAQLQRNEQAQQHLDAKRKLKETERQLKDLRSLDPTRLAKHNKTLKAKNEELKAANVALKAKNVELQKQIQKAAKDGVEKGIYPVYKDPIDGHLVKLVSYIRPKEDNTDDLVPHVPVVEFYHKTAGVMRQGCLNMEGGISWGSTKNTVPPARVSREVASLLVDYCERNKIKIPQDVKLAVREQSLKAAS